MDKIILYGNFGSGNTGNDASLEAALYHIKKYQPNANIICVCTGSGEVSKRFGIQTLPTSGAYTDKPGFGSQPSRIIRLCLRLTDEILFWLQSPKWFQPGDKFIVVGTGAVDDMGVRRPWHAPYTLYKWCKAAKLGGAQVIFLSVGVGPILNRISKFLMLKALRMADYRSYREMAAFNYLQSLGYDTSRDTLYPDLVFSLPKASLPVPKKLSATPTVVGLGLINYYGWLAVTGESVYQKYFSKIKHFVTWLLRAGFTVRVISGDIADMRPVREITEFVKEEGEPHWQEKLIVQEITNVNDLFYQIAQTDIIVASRFHNVLCSLMLGRPVISLGYHEKNDLLMKEMGLGRYCQHIEHFTTERLVEQFTACIHEVDQIVCQIHDQADYYRKLLDDQYEMLL
ncbi:MAG: hypothetical protein DYG89_31915 [Caldilinea sp. CFX5]|nr:hypothetical protein [Caldilinea sp. CFX5]